MRSLMFGRVCDAHSQGIRKGDVTETDVVAVDTRVSETEVVVVIVTEVVAAVVIEVVAAVAIEVVVVIAIVVAAVAAIEVLVVAIGTEVAVVTVVVAVAEVTVTCHIPRNNRLNVLTAPSLDPPPDPLAVATLGQVTPPTPLAGGGGDRVLRNSYTIYRSSYSVLN